MKKVVILLIAMALMAPSSFVAARDSNSGILWQQWKEQQAEQKKLDARFKAVEADSKTVITEPKAKSADKPAE